MGFCVVELAVPSPHDHSHDVGVLVLVSVAVILFGILVGFLFSVNDATGADGGANVRNGSGELYFLTNTQSVNIVAPGADPSIPIITGILLDVIYVVVDFGDIPSMEYMILVVPFLITVKI